MERYNLGMSYRNKTYVIFDGDDIHNYRSMRAWTQNAHIDFNFYDAIKQDKFAINL